MYISPETMVRFHLKSNQTIVFGLIVFSTFCSWTEAKGFTISQGNVENIEKRVQHPFIKDKSTWSHKCSYDEAWLFYFNANWWGKEPVFSADWTDGRWSDLCYFTPQISHSRSSTETPVTQGKIIISLKLLPWNSSGSCYHSDICILLYSSNVWLCSYACNQCSLHPALWNKRFLQERASIVGMQ